jgi:hypothetical protein
MKITELSFQFTDGVLYVLYKRTPILQKEFQSRKEAFAFARDNRNIIFNHAKSIVEG